jgi:hypothetical protein
MEDKSSSWSIDQEWWCGLVYRLWWSSIIRFQFQGMSTVHSPPCIIVIKLKKLTYIQGFRNHKIVDIFDEPGSSDLTANVDFTYLSESLSTTGSHSLGPIPQARFLLGLGLEPRMSKLLETATGERKEDIRKGATRLIDVLGMGSQYQVMGIEPGESGVGEVYPFPAKGSEGIEAVLAKPSSS